MKLCLRSFLVLLLCGSFAIPAYSFSNGEDSLLTGDPELDMSAPLPMPPGEGEQIYQRGKVFLDASIIMGFYGRSYRYGTRWNTLTPLIPLTANLEIAALDFIGIGGYFGVAGRRYGYRWSDRQRRETYTSFGLKGTFHVIPFLNKSFDFDHNLDGSKYDLYIAHYFGVVNRNRKLLDEDGDVLDNDMNFGHRIAIFNPVVGARYMFSGFFGVHAEAGYSPWGKDVKAGLSLRF